MVVLLPLHLTILSAIQCTFFRILKRTTKPACRWCLGSHAHTQSNAVRERTNTQEDSKTVSPRTAAAAAERPRCRRPGER